MRWLQALSGLSENVRLAAFGDLLTGIPAIGEDLLDERKYAARVRTTTVSWVLSIGAHGRAALAQSISRPAVAAAALSGPLLALFRLRLSQSDAWAATFSSIKTIQRRRPVVPPCGLAAKLPLSAYELPKPEKAGHWMKVAIVVEQRRAVFDAPGPDQEVDCLADCNPAPT